MDGSTGTPTPERLVVAVDVVLLTVLESRLRVLLVRRGPEDGPAGAGGWALPGVVVGAQEPLDAAAARALRDKAGVPGAFLEQLYTFGRPDRDPRSRVVSVAHYALVPHDALDGALNGAPDVALAAVDVPWAGETGGPVAARVGPEAEALAFDHADILGMAVLRLRGKLDYSAVGFELLPPRFPLRDLQAIHEAILDRPLNKDSFRRRIQQSRLVRATGERERDRPYRPAELFQFVRRSGAATDTQETT